MEEKMKTQQQAGFMRRMGAWFYDTLIISAIMMLTGGAIVATLEMLYGAGIISYGQYPDVSSYLNHDPLWRNLYPITLISIFAGFFAYFWCKGQTLGMRAWKLQVQQLDGSPITLTQAIIRMSTSAFGLGNLLVFISSDNSAFQDTWAKTRVIVLDKAI
jgi:uncharacterized RDD family membrane protein YckC